MTGGRAANRFPIDGGRGPCHAGRIQGPEAIRESCLPPPDLVSKAMTALLMGIIRFYQLTLSPFIGGQCRFHPTCSNYALDALASQGPLRGSWLALKRLLKCHPFHPGGFDPPPSREESREQ